MLLLSVIILCERGTGWYSNSNLNVCNMQDALFQKQIKTSVRVISKTLNTHFYFYVFIYFPHKLSLKQGHHLALLPLKEAEQHIQTHTFMLSYAL